MTDSKAQDRSAAPAHRPGSDVPFLAAIVSLSAAYVLLIVAMLAADATFTTLDAIGSALASEEIRYAIRLSLVSCTVTTLLSLWVAVPMGYLMSRFRFPGRNFLDAVVDIPIVLPPLVIGLSLLILFQTGPGRLIESVFVGAVHRLGWERITGITYDVPSVILAQFTVACAFAVRTMRVTFDQIDPRREDVALTLGCRRSRVFASVALPQARRGILTAATLSWSRALGEFGPILVFSGATRMRTEVMPTTVFLELSIGNLEAAVAVSLLMVTAAVIVLVVARLFGLRGSLL